MSNPSRYSDQPPLSDAVSRRCVSRTPFSSYWKSSTRWRPSAGSSTMPSASSASSSAVMGAICPVDGSRCVTPPVPSEPPESPSAGAPGDDTAGSSVNPNLTARIAERSRLPCAAKRPACWPKSSAAFNWRPVAATMASPCQTLGCDTVISPVRCAAHPIGHAVAAATDSSKHRTCQRFIPASSLWLSARQACTCVTDAPLAAALRPSPGTPAPLAAHADLLPAAVAAGGFHLQPGLRLALDTSGALRANRAGWCTGAPSPGPRPP